jgi:hypothetical protein
MCLHNHGVGHTLHVVEENVSVEINSSCFPIQCFCDTLYQALIQEGVQAVCLYLKKSWKLTVEVLKLEKILEIGHQFLMWIMPGSCPPPFPRSWRIRPCVYCTLDSGSTFLWHFVYVHVCILYFLFKKYIFGDFLYILIVSPIQAVVFLWHPLYCACQ